VLARALEGVREVVCLGVECASGLNLGSVSEVMTVINETLRSSTLVSS
jgi:hypothetical protein